MTPATEATPAPLAPSTPPAAFTAPPGTALQIATMLGAGTIDTSQAGKLARAGNLSMLDITRALSTLCEAAEPKEHDARSAQEKELDQAFPVARPEDYTIAYGGPGENVTMTPELRQADTLARNWMSEMGFTREAGSTIANIVNKLAQRQMSAEQVDAYRDAENLKLRSLYGDTWDQRLGPARDMIIAVDKKFPGLRNFLLAHGVGDSAVLVNMLVQQAAIYHARKKGP